MSDKPRQASPKKPGVKPRKTVAKTASAKKQTAGKATAEPAVAKKAAVKKAVATKSVAKQAVAKKAPARKATAKKAPADKHPAKQPDAKPVKQPDTKRAAESSPSRGAGAEPAPASAPGATQTATAPAELIRVPMAVRWRDLDAFNHVNNSKYLSYLEEARLHWMIGVPGQGMDDHVAPVVAAAQLNYRRPITWPAEVVIELFVERLGNTSLSIGHRIVDDDDNSILYCDGNVVIVWIDRDSGLPAALPKSVREACSQAE